MADAMTKTEQEEWAKMAGADNAARAAVEGEAEEEQTEQPEGEAEPPEAEASTEEGKGRPRFVPHAALHEERENRKRLEADNRKLLEERALFQGRLDAIMQMQRQPQSDQRQEQTEQELEPTDYVGRIERAERHLAEMRAGSQQRDQQLTEAQREQARIQHLASAADADVKQYRTKTADYDDAYKFFRDNRAAELEFYGVPAEQRAAIINQEELNIAAGAFQRGQSPAETLYRVAQHRGYKPKAATPNGDGADQAAERVERVAAGQQRAVTLSGTGGGATGTQMTAEGLLKMSNAEFDAWTSNPKNARAAKRLMGG